LLDEELVLYRTPDGQVHLARDICLHRGVRLSKGTVENGELVCKYHGFHYNGEGFCTRIPAQDPALPISSKLKLKTYPVLEQYGLVWTCLSPESNPPSLPDWPEFNDTAWEVIPMPPGVWNAAATRHIENFNDVAHLSFIHADTFGNRSQPRIQPYDVERNGQTLRFQIDYPQIDRASFDVATPQAVMMRYVYTLQAPFYARLEIRHPQGEDLILFDIPAPMAARQSRVYFFILRNCHFDQSFESYIEFQKAVLDEDQPMVEDQRPEDLPLDLREEVHIAADRLSIAYRQLLTELGLGRPLTA
jgi:vanillate O-demethylase monooxygenase subunit